MKVKLLIVCICIIVAAVGGKMSADFTSTKRNDIKNTQPSDTAEIDIELTKVSETVNEK